MPGTHWIEDWVGPSAGLEAVEKRKELTPFVIVLNYIQFCFSECWIYGVTGHSFFVAVMETKQFQGILFHFTAHFKLFSEMNVNVCRKYVFTAQQKYGKILECISRY